MSRPKSIPTYRLHKQSGQAVVTLTDPAGRRRDVLLGEHGLPESQAEYVRVLAEWEAMGRKTPTATGPIVGLTVAELLARFWEHAKKKYRRPDGTEKTELSAFTHSLRPLNFLYGNTVAAEFGPKALEAVRQLMVKGYKHPTYGPQKALARTNINRRIKRVKHVFKWAVREQLLPGSVLQVLQAVDGLRRGESEARETEPVKPVPLAHVRATQAKAPPIIADMIELQLLTGVRPGELVVMRGIDIDMTGSVWLFTPRKHKTQHHGHSRTIAIGPKGQAIVRRYLKPNVEAFLFSPAEAREERFRVMRAARKTKVQPSQLCRQKAAPKKLPGSKYQVGSYYQAIKRAIKRAGCPDWYPHRVRHTTGTEVRRQFGLDAARAVLGHKSAEMAELYAELDQGQAAAVMAKIG